MAKLNYKIKSKLEVFYTGGAARLSSDGTFVACACGDEVKVGLTLHKLPPCSHSMGNRHQQLRLMACRLWMWQLERSQRR